MELSKEKDIDLKKLREVVYDDLFQEKLFEWLEDNNTVSEKLTPSKKKASSSTSKKGGSKPIKIELQ